MALLMALFTVLTAPASPRARAANERMTGPGPHARRSAAPIGAGGGRTAAESSGVDNGTMSDNTLEC